jgi:pyruvate/2-oxoglutarate dehydrogenase complex dihydrolipoamide dehydrogenase (E3) component
MRDGVRVLTEVTVSGVECRDGEKVLKLDQRGAPIELSVDEILVAVGRVPNVTGLGLEAA